MSVPIETVLEEARRLAARGVRELMVIAQDTTYYGIDLYGRRRLADLLTELCRIDGIEWVRLHYAYPASFPDEVIDTMAREPKICKYLDIPFQHISDRNAVGHETPPHQSRGDGSRPSSARAYPRHRAAHDPAGGYPTEAEADVAELEEFVREARFDRLGVFPYSEEEGTYSAKTCPTMCPTRRKQRRADRIMALQERISFENNLARVGRVMRVVVDFAAGRLLRRAFGVRFARGGSGDIDPRGGSPPAARPFLRRAHHGSRGLRPLCRGDRPLAQKEVTVSGNVRSQY